MYVYIKLASFTEVNQLGKYFFFFSPWMKAKHKLLAVFIGNQHTLCLYKECFSSTFHFVTNRIGV